MIGNYEPLIETLSFLLGKPEIVSITLKGFSEFFATFLHRDKNNKASKLISRLCLNINKFNTKVIKLCQ